MIKCSQKLHTNSLFTDDDIVLLHRVVSKSAGFTESMYVQRYEEKSAKCTKKVYEFIFTDFKNVSFCTSVISKSSVFTKNVYALTI